MNELFRALPALLRQFDDNEAVREAVALAAWRKIVGESLKRHTVPVRLFRKQLIVAVSSDTWKRHLEDLSGQMIFRINSLLGQAVVTFIDFRVDEETIAAERRKQPGADIPPEELIERALGEVNVGMRISADTIKDENLRYQFLLAAGACLARKKRMQEADK